MGEGVHAGCSARQHPGRNLGVSPGDLPEAQRDREVGLAAEGLCRVFSRFKKLDTLFLGFVLFAPIAGAPG